MKKRNLLVLLLVAALCLSLFPTALAAEEARDIPAESGLPETAPQMPDNPRPQVLTGCANEWEPKEYAVASDTRDIERGGRFDGSLDLIKTQGAELDYVLNISPASALDNVLSVKALVKYSNVKTGEAYVLGESDIDKADWEDGRFEHQFAETWYAINDKFVSLNSAWSMEMEDGTLYKLFRIPALVDYRVKTTLR